MAWSYKPHHYAGRCCHICFSGNDILQNTLAEDWHTFFDHRWSDVKETLSARKAQTWNESNMWLCTGGQVLSVGVKQSANTWDYSNYLYSPLTLKVPAFIQMHLVGHCSLLLCLVSLQSTYRKCGESHNWSSFCFYSGCVEKLWWYRGTNSELYGLIDYKNEYNFLFSWPPLVASFSGFHSASLCCSVGGRCGILKSVFPVWNLGKWSYKQLHHRFCSSL